VAQVKILDLNCLQQLWNGLCLKFHKRCIANIMANYDYHSYFLQIIHCQLINIMQTESHNSKGKNSFINNPVSYPTIIIEFNLEFLYFFRCCLCIILGY
jgi:hypothetical protein